jgi:hypothetical protein
MEVFVWTRPPPPPDDDAWAFGKMVSSSVKSMKSQCSQFMKKLEEIPKAPLSPFSSRRKAIGFSNRGLIKQHEYGHPQRQ